MKDWLDPNDTGTTTLDGIDGPSELDVTISGPDQVLEGQNETWDATIANGNAPYDAVRFLTKTNTTPWSTLCMLGSTSSTPSCTASLSDSDSQNDTHYVEVRVDDENKWHGEDQMSVVVYESSSLTTSAKKAAAPERYELKSPSPNPAQETAQIRFALPEATKVTLVVYDVMGRVVRHLVDRQLSMGHKLVPVDVSNLPSGTYFYRLRAGDFVRTRRLTVVR